MKKKKTDAQLDINPIRDLQIPPLDEIEKERNRLISGKEKKMITIMVIILILLMLIAVFLLGLLMGFLPEEQIEKMLRML